MTERKQDEMNAISMPRQDSVIHNSSFWYVCLGILLLAGFWVRLSFLFASYYHVDEFISMLAARMVAQRGLPILPSGLFYDQGLLFSYLSGAFVALLGFSEEVARWPTMLVSVLTIAVYYVTAKRLFGSRLTGVLAAALVTLDQLSVLWGVRARMYALAHLFVLLSLAWLLQSTLKRPSQRGRLLFIAFLTGAFLSHTLTFLSVPVLLILLFAFTPVYRSEWLRSPRLWREAVISVIMVLIVLAVVVTGQAGSMVSPQDLNVDAPPPLGLGFVRGFLSPGVAWSRFDNFVGFFQTPAYKWLLPVIAASLVISCLRTFRRKTAFSDVACFFLAAYMALMILEIGGLRAEEWHKSRYSFFLTLPAFLLLSAEGLARLLRGAAYLVSRFRGDAHQRQWLRQLMPLAGVAVIVVMWGPDAWRTAHAKATGDYNTAFAFVGENWRPGDKILTVHPSAAYLYLGRCDYYANQVTPKVLSTDADGTDTAYVDRYTGSPLIDSVEVLNAVLAEEAHQVWFVVDQHRLYERYQPLFTQQIFAQMDFVNQAGTVYTFVSRHHPVPLPAEPTSTLDGTFGDLIRLEGYSLDPTSITPDGVVPLALFWRPIGTPTRPMKVFVQLRNGQGETIAQADHLIYEGLLTLAEWNRLQAAGEWLRDSADLRLPLPLPTDEGPYRIYVGLYDPNTFERVPLVNDTSGAHAAIIDLSALP